LSSLAKRTRALAEGATALLAPRKIQPVADPLTLKRAGWIPLTAPPAPKAAIASDGRGLVVASAEVRILVVAPGEPAGWFAAISGAGLWKSGDGGQSWAQCPGLPSEVYAVRPDAGRPGHVWAATSDGCWL